MDLFNLGLTLDASKFYSAGLAPLQVHGRFQGIATYLTLVWGHCYSGNAILQVYTTGGFYLLYTP